MMRLMMTMMILIINSRLCVPSLSVSFSEDTFLLLVYSIKGLREIERKRRVLRSYFSLKLQIDSLFTLNYGSLFPSELMRTEMKERRRREEPESQEEEQPTVSSLSSCCFP